MSTVNLANYELFGVVQNPIMLAKSMAALTHAGQTRNDGQTPYIRHPLRVASTVMEYTQDQRLICVALLHDTIEDGKGLTVDNAVSLFQSMDVWDGVVLLTKTSTDRPDAPDKECSAYLQRIAGDGRGSRARYSGSTLIKLADRLDNISEDMALDDVAFAANVEWRKRYVSKTWHLLSVFMPDNMSKDREHSQYVEACRDLHDRVRSATLAVQRRIERLPTLPTWQPLPERK